MLKTMNTSINAFIRNDKSYIARSGFIFPQAKEAVSKWDSLFNIPYYEFRKKLRKISVSILKEQCFDQIYLCLDWGRVWNFEKYGNQIYVPMDDDDIFILTEEDREIILKDLKEHNAVVVTMYDGQTGYEPKSESFGYIPQINQGGRYQCLSNNLIYKHDFEIIDCEEIPFYHNRHIKRLKISERKDLKTSLHFLHPCSVSMITGTQSGVSYPRSDDEIVRSVEKFKKQQDLSGVPKRFYNYIDIFLDLYNKLTTK
jgi:hypothetical protein